MKPTITIAGLACTAAISASAQNLFGNGNLELGVGGAFFTGDLRTIGGFDTGLTVRLNYMSSQTYGADLKGWRPFVGLSYVRAESGGFEGRSIGFHVGGRYDFQPRKSIERPEQFYGNVAITGMNVRFSPDKWGVGAFAGLGFQFTRQFGVEGGYQFAPPNNGINHSWFYAMATIRL